MLQFKYIEFLFDFYSYYKAEALSIFSYRKVGVNFDETIYDTTFSIASLGQKIFHIWHHHIYVVAFSTSNSYRGKALN